MTITEYAIIHGVNGNTFKFNVPILGYKDLEKDSIKYNFWNLMVSTYEYADVDKVFSQGRVILKHALTDDCIFMDKDTFAKYLYHPETIIYTNFMDWLKESNKIEEEMHKISDEVNDSGVLAPGYIYTSPVADGHSTYVVTKVTKASVYISHRRFGDGYRDNMIDALNGKIPLKTFMQISFFGKPSIPFGKAMG